MLRRTCGKARAQQEHYTSTVLSPSRQLSCGAGHTIKETLVECRHLAHIRFVGENHLLLQFLCNDVGREGRHAARLTRILHGVPVAFELDGAAVVDRQLRQVQTTVIILDDRRNGRLNVSRQPTLRQITPAANARSSSIPLPHQAHAKKHKCVTSVSICVKRSHLTAHASTKHHPLRSYAAPKKSKRKMGLQPWYDSPKKRDR